MTKIRIIEDFDSHRAAVAPGTVIQEAMIDPEYNDAWYRHPVTGTPWFSFEGDYEVLEDD